MQSIAETASSLFNTSREIFWSALPVVLLLALTTMFVSGQISGSRLTSIFKRLLIAIMLLVALPQISSFFTNLDRSLVSAFGGEQSIQSVFTKSADHVKEVKNAGISTWIKIGQMSLSIITTLSFIVLAFVQKFLMVLRSVVWNLLHIVAPLALLGCLFPTFEQIPKGIFIGLFEIALWRPLWAILCRLLLAIGFGETPTDLSQWLDLAIMNFAVAALMVCTPALVHGFLSGTLASIGGGAVQSMIGGAGVLLAGAPALAAKKGFGVAKNRVVKPMGKNLFVKPVARVWRKISPSKQRQGSNQNRKFNGISKTK